MTTDQVSLEWMVLRAQSGDAEALEVVLREAARTTMPMLRRMAGDEASDVLQDVLWSVSRKLQWLDDVQAFRAWTWRIAVRAALKHLKREQRRWPFEQNQDLEGVAAPATSEARLGREDVEAFLTRLSPRSRIVVVLHYLEEMRLDQIAALLEVPLGTVKSRLAYGLAAMRRHAKESRS